MEKIVSHVKVNATTGSHPRAGRASFLPFHRPWIDDGEVQAVSNVLRSGWLTMGRTTFEFEEAFARTVGARYAVAVNSCTAALQLSLNAVGVGPGDEVITSVYTFASTAAVAVHLGATPVLADVLPGPLTIDPAQIAARITPRTRAIVPVHMAGVPADMDAILDLAGRHDLRVVEDAAHALPSWYGDRPIGSIGDLTAFSFYAGKNITTGEGGMITTDREEWANTLRQRRLHGIDRDAWKRYAGDGSWFYEVGYPGFKCNMTDLNAALGLEQLRKLERFHGIRSYYAGLYHTGLADLPELVLPEAPPSTQHAWHLYIVRLNLDGLTIDRDTFVRLLRERNIGTSVHFIPLHLHRWYRDTFGYKPEDFPVALGAYRAAVSLPLYPRMSEADVWDVIDAVRDIVTSHRAGRAS
jgi:dTDP-4-amino-4,6-dideoxygalactose transaminase